MFKEVCVAELPLGIERILPDTDLSLKLQPARRGSVCFKSFKISKNGDGTVLEIVVLHAVITETVNFFKRNLVKRFDIVQNKVE